MDPVKITLPRARMHSKGTGVGVRVGFVWSSQSTFTLYEVICVQVSNVKSVRVEHRRE